MLQKHLQTTDWESGYEFNQRYNVDYYSIIDNNDAKFYIKIPTASIDTTGAIDVSDTINFYLNTAFVLSMDSFIITVLLPPGILLLEKTINIPSGVYLKGYGADKTLFKCNVGEGKACFEMKPANAKPVATFPLAKPIRKGDDLVYVNKILADQYLANKSKPIFAAVTKLNDSLLITSSWAKGTVKEHFWFSKEAVSSGNYQITASVDSKIPFSFQGKLFTSIKPFYGDGIWNTNKPFVLSYDTGMNNAEVQIFEYVKYAGLLCLGIERIDTTSSQTSNIVLTNAVQCVVKAVESKNCNFAHIELNNSFINVIKRCHLQNGNGYGGGGKAYGILLQEGSSSNSILDNVLHHLRHSILLQSGANNNIVIANYSYDPYWTETSFPSDAAGDIVLHGNYPFANLFEFNVAQQVVIDDSHGKNGPFNIFHRNWLQNYGITFSVSNGSDSQVFTGNEATNTGFFKGLYLLQDGGHFEYGNKVRGNLQPASTSLSLTKSVSHLNFNAQYRRTFGGFDYPDIIDNNKVPFGEPFNQNNKSITALLRMDTVPNCYDASLDLIYGRGGVEALEKTSKPFAFPNPSSGLLQITQQGNLQVFDLAGKLVLEKEIGASENNVSLTVAGLYVLKIIHKGKIDTQKVLITF